MRFAVLGGKPRPETSMAGTQSEGRVEGNNDQGGEHSRGRRKGPICCRGWMPEEAGLECAPLGRAPRALLPSLGRVPEAIARLKGMGGHGRAGGEGWGGQGRWKGLGRRAGEEATCVGTGRRLGRQAGEAGWGGGHGLRGEP